jgi:hypothetical protein
MGCPRLSADVQRNVLKSVADVRTHDFVVSMFLKCRADNFYIQLAMDPRKMAKTGGGHGCEFAVVIIE